MIHFLIVQLGSDDLMQLALASIERFAGEHVNVDIVKLPLDTTDPHAHGRAIDHWRRHQQIAVMDKDVVVIMDPDVILLSAQWRTTLDAAFADAQVGAWGAGNARLWGPRIHAHMLAVRGVVFNTLERTFTPCLDLREQEWRDTAGMYCMWVRAAGWLLQPVEQGENWAGVSAWPPLWAHLGGGSHSDVTRMTWRQRLVPWRHRAIRQRKRFIAAARAHLTR